MGYKLLLMPLSSVTVSLSAGYNFPNVNLHPNLSISLLILTKYIIVHHASRDENDKCGHDALQTKDGIARYTIDYPCNDAKHHSKPIDFHLATPPIKMDVRTGFEPA